MLLKTAIGDAYGVGFEFRPKAFVLKHNQLEAYFPHERYETLHKKYSDDTQMSIALAELIIAGTDWTATNIADKFVEVFQRDVRPGYSSRMYNALSTSKNGADFLSNINDQSEGSGAAMRSGVIGLLKKEDEILAKAALQARTTHDTAIGVSSAQVVALATHYFAYALGPKKKVEAYIHSFLSVDWLKAWNGPVFAKGDACVNAAITALKRNHTLAELLQDCISFTGDVDTVAAIAMGLAAFSKEIDQNLPQWMYDELENETYGRDYLLGLDQRLRSLV